MKNLNVVFMDCDTVAARLIKTRTKGQWSHVGVKVGDGYLIDSRWGDKGVTMVELTKRLGFYPRTYMVSTNIPEEPVIELVKSQLGKPYDWTALFGIAVNRNWQEDDSWFCSELVAWACHQAGYPVVHVPQWRVTPQDLFVAMR